MQTIQSNHLILHINMQYRRQDEIRPFRSPEITFYKNRNMYKINLNEGKIDS